jgi:hypothetical protein
MLREHVAPLDTPERRVSYLTGDFPRSDQVKDLDKRYRWDLYWYAVRCSHNLPDTINDAGYDDAHLDTALRSIVPLLKD